MFVAPELAKVARAILAITASEASVERSFSKQKIIHRALRSRLLHDHVVDEMVVRSNLHLFEEK